MTKPIAFWKALEAKKLKEREELRINCSRLEYTAQHRPSKWVKRRQRWVLCDRNRKRHMIHVLKHMMILSKYIWLKRALRKVDRSLAYIRERLGVQRSVWDHLRAGGKEARRDALRRATGR
jgi:hypothetical protein